ncbi:MAG: hypothetical protein AAF721_05810 [Myxococcota bacterium]
MTGNHAATLVVLATLLASGCRQPSRVAQTPGAPEHAASGSETVGPELGTAHPLTVRRVAPDGEWVVLCQARQDTDGEDGVAVFITSHGGNAGDALEPYLIWNDGSELKLDSFVASGASGEVVVVVRDGELQAHRAGQPPVTLSATPAADDTNPTLPPRAASVAPTAPVIAHLEGRSVVVRNLSEPTARKIDIGVGLWRVEVLGDGTWARAYVVAEDTDGSGAIEMPVLVTTLPDDDCAGEPMAYSTYGWSGDTPSTVWLNLERGTIEGQAAVPASIKHGSAEAAATTTDFKYTRGNRQFRLAGERWVILDRTTGETTDVAPAPFGADMRMAGDYAVISGTVLRLSTLEVLGKVAGVTYTLLPDGRILTGPPPDAFGVRPSGPLRWQSFR